MFVTLRLFMTCGIFLAVIAAFGAVSSPLVVLALPAAVLTGLAFAPGLMAWAVTRTTDVSFAVLMRFVMVPLFLFSGTFFPISQLPGWLQPVAYVTPLWHGVALCRSLALGHADLGARPCTSATCWCWPWRAAWPRSGPTPSGSMSNAPAPARPRLRPPPPRPAGRCSGCPCPGCPAGPACPWSSGTPAPTGTCGSCW